MGIKKWRYARIVLGPLVHVICVATELYGEIQFNADSFRITTIIHPATYLNKILLGSQQGSLQLWNIRTRYFYG